MTIAQRFSVGLDVREAPVPKGRLNGRETIKAQLSLWDVG